MITLASFLFVVAAMAQAALLATFVILERDTESRYSKIPNGYGKRKNSLDRGARDRKA